MKTIALDASDGDDVAEGGSRPIALVEGGPPPTEYMMFAPGVNPTTKGDLVFTDESAAAVLAYYESRGRKRLAGDWEHDSMVPPPERPAGYKGSPASHWFDLEVRPGPELWATNVKWTPTAFAQIAAGEYAHTSPVAKFRKSDSVIMAVISSALTNDPATIGQPQMIAASAESTKPAAPVTEKSAMYKMPDEAATKLKALIDGEHADEKEMCGKMTACMTESFPESMKKDEEKLAEQTLDPAAAAKLADGEKERKAEEIEEKKELTAYRASLKALTGKDARNEQIAVLTAQKIQSEEVVTLNARLTEKSDAQFNAVLDKARTDKKLTPADCAAGSKTARGAYIASLRATYDVVALRAFVEPMGAVVNTTSTPEPRTPDLATVTLTADEIQSCERNGIDKNAYLRNKQARIADGTAPSFALRS